MRLKYLIAFSSLILICATSRAATHKLRSLRQEIGDPRNQLNENRNSVKEATPIGRADALVANKYGPNAKVTTQQGKLYIGGLVQVWMYSIEIDREDYPGPSIRSSSNEVFDNDSFRVRRAELKFSLEITEDITAVVMLDPSGGDSGNSFPGLPSNQGLAGKSDLGNEFFTQALLDEFASNNNALTNGIAGPQVFGFVARRRMQNGTVRPNRVLQEAYINYNSYSIPHHDFTIGQFLPPMGEEGSRDSGQLDFVERAMINQFSHERDLGLVSPWRTGKGILVARRMGLHERSAAPRF